MKMTVQFERRPSGFSARRFEDIHHRLDALGSSFILWRRRGTVARDFSNGATRRRSRHRSLFPLNLAHHHAVPRPVLHAEPVRSNSTGSAWIVPGTTEKTRSYGVTHLPVKILSSFPGVSANYDAPTRTLR